jgi:hypothetical protein
VTVVFDASRAPAHARASEVVAGIQVHYALGGQTADDVIEDLLRRAAAPRALTLISDDHRLQQAARRRQALVQGCLDFLEMLQGQRLARRPPPAPAPEKAAAPSPQETQHWLGVFGDLERDPEFKDLFERFGTDELD